MRRARPRVRGMARPVLDVGAITLAFEQQIPVGKAKGIFFASHSRRVGALAREASR